MYLTVKDTKYKLSFIKMQERIFKPPTMLQLLKVFWEIQKFHYCKASQYGDCRYTTLVIPSFLRLLGL